MKFLALEKEIDGCSWLHSEALLKEEAHQVFQLYCSDCLREIYFNENKNAVLILEMNNKMEAIELLETLPLVQAGKIRFDLMELHPYNGFQRLMESR